MGEQDEVAKVAVPVAHVIPEQPLRVESQRAEHRHGSLLVGDHLDEQLAETTLEGSQQRPARQPAPEPTAAVLGIDYEPQLPHVVRPAGQRDDGDVAGDVAVLDRDPARAAVRAQPALDGRTVEHRLLEEGPLGLRDPSEEVHQRVEVTGCGGAKLHHTGSLWSAVQPAIPGSVTFAAARPATSPTCPAASRSSSASSDPTSRGTGSAAGSGTMWSRSAITFSSGPRVAPSPTRSPPSSRLPSMSALRRTSCSTVCRHAAPGK